MFFLHVFLCDIEFVLIMRHALQTLLLMSCNILFLDTTSYKSATATKAVYGLTADQVVEYRLASYYESQVHIWDRRHFDKPISFNMIGLKERY